MGNRRLLVKLSQPPGAWRKAFGATWSQAVLRPLFDVPQAAATFGADAPREQSWWSLESDDTAMSLDKSNDWDRAHALLRDGLGDADIVAVEPDFEQRWAQNPSVKAALTPQGFAAGACVPQAQAEGSLPPGPGFAWHLDAKFSGLKPARDSLMAKGSDVVIVHLDTGYVENHRALPEKLDLARQRNFVPNEDPKSAVDVTPKDGFLANRGHGIATMGLLAGGKLSDLELPKGRKSDDYLGGAPLAQVVPVRIADSVVHFWTSSMAAGIDYACKIGADIVTISMGGLPSAVWADAVNAAYEAGILIVAAAGNNFGGLPVSDIVWPARFGRVLAACGVMANGRPYSNLPFDVMAGNHGPRSKMGTALAAYTPNVPWLRADECRNVVDETGSGTSSATPQIAAAAALWLRKYKTDIAKYPEPWMRVEAVRLALFQSAKPVSAPVDPFFGEGIVDAVALLKQQPGAVSALRKQPRDFGPFDFFSVIGLGMDEQARDIPLLQLELTQLAATSSAVRDILPDPGLRRDNVMDADRLRVFQTILDESKTSQALRRYLENQVGRVSVRSENSRRPYPPLPSPQPAPDRRTPRGGETAHPAPAAISPPTDVLRQTRRRPPQKRRLSIFASDPGLGTTLATSGISEAVVSVPWETSPSNTNLLQPGPIGEYIEVIDVDPASAAVYDPVDLNDPFLLAQDGVAPSEGDPQFHQQMTYAVAMRTIGTFEAALGRRVLWSTRRVFHKGEVPPFEEFFVPRLRIYPHALRQANAYYSPDKISLLFGYFPAKLEDAAPGEVGNMVFTCLSHDIVAHETTHAILDGLHRRYQEPTNLDVLAFHEAFADIVAIFQHFTMPELLESEIARTRGEVRLGGLLADLAQQFGHALGRSSALRSAIDVDPAKINYTATTEPHERGSILLAAVFAAFVSIYERRSADLVRLATGGSGVLAPGNIHPDLVKRLADEAAKVAHQVLNICIRALDYCPPHDVTFPDYLRALITADFDVVGEDPYGYRTAFLEAFRARGIYPRDIRTVSVESLLWGSPIVQPPGLGQVLVEMNIAWGRGDRLSAHNRAKQNAATLHDWLANPKNMSEEMAATFGLNRYIGGGERWKEGFTNFDELGRPRFEVHSVRPARRVSPDGEIKTDIIAVITQQRMARADKDVPIDPKDPLTWFRFRGGTTLVMDASGRDNPIRYSVLKSLGSERREKLQREYRDEAAGGSLHSLYFGDEMSGREPFALLHIGQ